MPVAHTLVVYQKARCRVEGAAVVGAQLRLLPTWLLLTGWSLRGRYRRRILFWRVEGVEAFPGDGRKGRLVVHLQGRDPLLLEVEGAEQWRQAIEERLHDWRLARRVQRRRAYVHRPLYTLGEPEAA